MSPHSSSRPQFILMIGDEGVLFVPYNVPDTAEPFFAAEKNHAGIEAILDILERNPRVPLVLFADNLAQDFRRESIPRLSFLDRPKLIERRLKQAFPQAGLVANLNCKNDRTHIFLAGVHSDSPVFDWIRRLKERCGDHHPRIALLPIECADICIRLLPEAADGWALLLSRQRTGGFRQIITHKGELIFTRLTPPLPHSASASELVEAIARDIKASLGYLGRLGLSDTAELRVALLMPESVHMALKALSLPVHSMRVLAPHQAAWELDPSSKLEKTEAYSDVIYARWMSRKQKPLLSLTPPDLKQAQHVATVKDWGWRMAAAALFIAFIMTGLQAGDLFSTLLKTQQEATQLETLQKRLTEEQATAAPITEPLGRLRQAVERRRLFFEPVATPWVMLEKLNAGLGSEARLVRLDWHSEGDKTEIMQVDVRFAQGALLPIADREAVAAHFQKLAQDIEHAMPGYDVHLTRYPFPALPQEALSNEGTAKNMALADDTASLTLRRNAP